MLKCTNNKRKILCNKENVLVSSDLLKIKAKTIDQSLDENPNFSASDEWMQRFKKRFGRYLKISDEKFQDV